MLHPAFAPLADRIFQAEVIARRIDRARQRATREQVALVTDLAARRCPVLDLVAAEEALLLPLLDDHPAAAAGAIAASLRSRHQALRNGHAATIHFVATGGDPGPALDGLGTALRDHALDLRERALPWAQDNVPASRLQEAGRQAQARLKERP